MVGCEQPLLSQLRCDRARGSGEDQVEQVPNRNKVPVCDACGWSRSSASLPSQGHPHLHGDGTQ